MLTIQALDHLDPIGEIGDFLEITYNEVDLAVGSWSLKLPDTDTARRLWDARWPGIAIHNPETGWWGGGFQTRRRVEFDNRRLTFTFSGLDFQGLLAHRKFWPTMPTHTGAAWVEYQPNTLTLTLAAHNIAFRTFGAGAGADPPIPGFAQIVVDEGPIEPWSPVVSSCLELWRDQFAGTDWTVRLAYDVDRAGAVNEPRLLFTTPRRETSPLVLSAETGEITSGSIEERAALVTAAYAAGDWIDENDHSLGRLLVDRVTPETDWRTRHVVGVIDRPGLTEAQMRSENDAWHRSQGQHRSTEISDASITGWGRDIDLGWWVLTDLGIAARPDPVELPVVSMALKATPAEGWKMTAQLGQETKQGAAYLAELVAQLGQRVRRLERP